MDDIEAGLVKTLSERKLIGKALMALGLVIGVLGLIGDISGWGSIAIIIIFIGLLSGAGSESKLAAYRAQLNREANARKRLRDIFTQAGNSPAEVEDKTRLAETLLRQGKGNDWTEFGPTKISEIVQGVEALKGRKPPIAE
jgi:hypothetical protein